MKEYKVELDFSVSQVYLFLHKCQFGISHIVSLFLRFSQWEKCFPKSFLDFWTASKGFGRGGVWSCMYLHCHCWHWRGSKMPETCSESLPREENHSIFLWKLEVCPNSQIKWFSSLERHVQGCRHLGPSPKHRTPCLWESTWVPVMTWCIWCCWDHTHY